MRRGLILLPAIFITIAASAAVQLDPATGLWFPPYATPEIYLKRDPAHPYSRDVKRAFDENPALATEVCAAVAAQKESPSKDPSVRQYAAMLSMMCVSRAANAIAVREQQKEETKTHGGLAAMFEEEEAAIASIPRDRRSAEADRLLEEIRAEGSDEILRKGLRAIALDPSLTFSPAELLIIPYSLNDAKTSYLTRDVAAFIEQLYRTRAATRRSDSPQWKSALPAVLLFRGKLSDASAAAAAWVAEAPEDKIWFAKTMVAVIDAASGKPNAFAKLFADCGGSPRWRAENEGRPPSEYCLAAASGMVMYALDAQRDRATPALARVAFDLESMQPENWPMRLRLVHVASRVDVNEAKAHFYKMLADENAPEGAQIDAVYYLAKIAADHEPAAAGALFDCWLRMHEVHVPPLPADAWTRLAATPERLAVNPPLECFAPETGPGDSWCVMRALELRTSSAITAKQWDDARESIERMLSLLLSSKQTLSMNGVREALYNLGAQLAEDPAHEKEASLILGYLAAQPHSVYLESQLARFRNLAKRAAEPWPASERHAASESAECPPRAPR